MKTGLELSELTSDVRAKYLAIKEVYRPKTKFSPWAIFGCYVIWTIALFYFMWEGF